MNIYITDPIHDLPLSKAKNSGKVILWSDQEINDWSDADAIIVRTNKVTKDKMLKSPHLKIIAKHGIGTDNIDLEAAKELGIIVTNTPQANIESVAELAVSLILSCARNIPKAFGMVKEGIEMLAPKELTGIELYGKTVGLIGLGKIGLRVGTILRDGFNMNIVGYDPYLSFDKALELGVKKYDNLKDMLSISDTISISVPLLPSTINLISKDEFDVMKSTAILVNTSRGKIVNEADLYEALKSKKIKAAALDVFEIEPPLRENPLFSLDNFIGTPHIGAATEEALVNMGQTAVDEIIRVRDGLEPLYMVK
jgi:D-3-phosphoglycerate dehydrogenase